MINGLAELGSLKELVTRVPRDKLELGTASHCKRSLSLVTLVISKSLSLVTLVIKYGYYGTSA